MAEEKAVLDALFASVNEVLAKADLSGVSAEGTGAKELPDGYFLSELQVAELQLGKNSGKPQAKLTLKTIEDGVNQEVDEEGNVDVTPLKKTSNKFIYIYYPLKVDDMGESVKKFASDMMKFESKPGEPVLPKEAYTRADVLNDALELLSSMKLRIYVHISTTTRLVDGIEVASTWKNLVSWKRARGLELPC